MASWKIAEEASGSAPAANEVKSSGAKEKCNALWVDPSAPAGGVQGWEFEILAGKGDWVGATVDSQLKAGWGLGGLMYGGPGNLSDGGALVQGSWGPSFAAGDKIVMRVAVEAGSAAVAFAKNGEPLGTAYALANWTGGALRPVVSLGKGAHVRIAPVPPPPAEAFVPSGAVAPGVEGKWQAADPGRRVGVVIGPVQDGKRAVSACVGNTMSTTVTEGADGAVQASGGVMSTRMMPPPQLRDLEQSIHALLAGLTRVARDGEALVLAAGERVERFVAKGPAPAATEEQVRWVKKL